ncbi:Elongator complex protein 4 [Candida viswanathii]|uniref:Elongator complex protein 4 n=1 Tax=Candida viswanathii TaxID=5486 RepID=A0A367YCD4_9ASCO|nr:Elongator complex protein 4 [Candida viswanathii]
MSFRKRGEIIGGAPPRTPAVPGRTPVVPGRASAVPGRTPPAAAGATPLRGPAGRAPIAKPDRTPDATSQIMKNPGVRPSLATSQPTTSTGSSDLDKILLHQGLPLGNSLLIEESGTTDFASVLLRACVSQGVMHNRISNEQNAHSIVLGVTPQWSNELPGVYKGSSKEQKRAKIIENESKVNVSNLSNVPSSSTRAADPNLKIAWRYGLNKKPESKEEVEKTTYEHYNNQFDLTQKLTPGPNPQDITYVPLAASFTTMINQISSIIKTQLRSNPTKIIRLVIPSILNPSLYHPLFTSPSFIFPFIHSLRSLLRQHSNNLVVVCSVSLDLYPKGSSLITLMQSLFDAVIHLQPFNQEMTQLLEKAYKNEPSKIQQGLVNIIKIPVLSERGLMMVHDGEYAFKNGRKKFEIEEWSIPVEDDSKETNQTQEGGQTTKNIDF